MNAAFDIAVVGAGAAGLAAAITAARAGCATVLLDARAAAGGTGGFSGLTTLCGLFDDAGKFLNSGFAREFADALAEGPPQLLGKVWVLVYRPEKYRARAAECLATTPNLQTRWNTPLQDAALDGDRIVSLNGIPVRAVIDCSGSAEIARAIHIDCLATNDSTQAPAVVFPLVNVSAAPKTPADLARVLLPLARAGLPPISFQPSLEPNTITAKFAGKPSQVAQVIEILRREAGGFENCFTPLTHFIASQRAGRMIIGQYLLTGADVLTGRKFDDAVVRCAWPIEQWDTSGQPQLRYLPAGAHYEIPARSLRAARVENLFMAGKTISADVDAIASARVMGCCLATGAAAANLAAAWLASGGKS